MSRKPGSTGVWSSTRAGRLARYIGSVRFAVPALALAAAAMIWGTWVESTEGRLAAAEVVYGSWWFVLLMALICASLVLSVAVRYPWKPKHTGFIIVHASLISLIVIGFYTMFTKIEGIVTLEEGERSSVAVLQDRWVERLQTQSANPAAVERFVIAGDKPIELDGVTFDILDTWDNSAEVTRITNDGPRPFHAIEIAGGPDAWEATAGDWLGEIGDDIAAVRSDTTNLSVRVVPTGQTWTAPAGPPAPVLVDGTGTAFPIEQGGLGETGWSVTAVETFTRATIISNALVDSDNARPNLAVRVILAHEDGSTEQQIAFEKVRDAPVVSQQSGQTASGLVLTYRGPSFVDQLTLAVMRNDDGAMRAVLTDPEGDTRTIEHDGEWPWRLSAGMTPISILRSYDRARASMVLEKAPPQEFTSPVLIVSTDQGPVNLVWNVPTPVRVEGRDMVLRYSSAWVPLPFEIQLVDFRKLDYPGVDMAMAFESDVLVRDLTGRDDTAGEPIDFKIHMNHPYKQDGWKVYQSGFLGDNTTQLQVTRDPGLIPMYAACSTLCLGILLIFYSRKLSFGHPGIPAPFTESNNGKQEGAR